jgi:3-oxoacyl-[acyl-carrier-protein] synthase-1
LQLALPPALEALQPLPAGKPLPAPLSVLVALPEPRPGLSADLSDRFGRQFAAGLKEQGLDVQQLDCHAWGHAGGLVCMEQARSRIEDGSCQLCLVGGVDSYMETETLKWLDSTDQLHSETTIWGFCPGEGAGFCLLAAPDLAERLGLKAAIRLRSAGSALEANRIGTDTVCIGEGLSEAFEKTLAGLSGARVDHTICDMNGEPYRGNEFGFAMMRSSGQFAEGADFETPADCWGDLGAASGPLFAMLAGIAASKGYAPGPLTFLWASSQGGQRAGALLQASDGHKRMERN